MICNTSVRNAGEKGTSKSLFTTIFFHILFNLNLPSSSKAKEGLSILFSPIKSREEACLDKLHKTYDKILCALSRSQASFPVTYGEKNGPKNIELIGRELLIVASG